mgnify:CR=1 FL=1
MQDHNPNVTVFLERLAPGHSNIMSSQNTYTLGQFNNYIDIIATNQTNSTSKIIAVDMTTNWSDDYMADNLHYNTLGAEEIANRYYAAILASLPK